jgi:hypothetical protein
MIYKWPINPITNPNPVYSHSYTWEYKHVTKDIFIRLNKEHNMVQN